jgi:hypothetical protein
MAADRHLQDAPLSPQEASAYLRERWGLTFGVRSLQVRRRTGDTAEFHRVGNRVLYTKAALDAWATQKLDQPLRNNSERTARRLMAAAASKEGTAA